MREVRRGGRDNSREGVVRIESEVKEGDCATCAGCGKIADSEEGEPWSMWEALPTVSKAAVALGIVKAIECPSCKGTGRTS